MGDKVLIKPLSGKRKAHHDKKSREGQGAVKRRRLTAQRYRKNMNHQLRVSTGWQSPFVEGLGLLARMK